MSISNLAKAIGQIGLLNAGKLSYPVRITDARVCYNRTDYLVTPIGGQGETWVSAERVSIQNAEVQQ